MKRRIWIRRRDRVRQRYWVGRNFGSSQRKRKAPIEKLIPHLYSDELGFATEHTDKVGLKLGEGKVIPATHFSIDSNVPPELEPYTTTIKDSSVKHFKIPKHADNLTSEQIFLRRRAKEFMREAGGQIPKTYNEKSIPWLGRLEKEIAVERATKSLGKEFEESSSKDKFVRITSGDDRVGVLGPFKTIVEAKEAKKEYLESVNKERKTREKLFSGSRDRPFLSGKKDTDLGDFPYSINIMDKDQLNEFGKAQSFKRGTKHEKIFPLELLE